MNCIRYKALLIFLVNTLHCGFFLYIKQTIPLILLFIYSVHLNNFFHILHNEQRTYSIIYKMSMTYDIYSLPVAVIVVSILNTSFNLSSLSFTKIYYLPILIDNLL